MSFVIGAMAMPAATAPPPPPPSEVVDVAKLLTDETGAFAENRLAEYIANDVRMYVNGELVANGKANWLRQYSNRQVRSRTLAYSPGWEHGGSLMVVDQYDRVDRSGLPLTAVADPRYVSRATLYEFGLDKKIHTIRTLVGGGFWIRPKTESASQ